MSRSEAVRKREGKGLEDAKSAWAGTLDGRSDEEKDRLALATAVIVRGIAEQGSVSPEALGAQHVTSST